MQINTNTNTIQIRSEFKWAASSRKTMLVSAVSLFAQWQIIFRHHRRMNKSVSLATKKISILSIMQFLQYWTAEADWMGSVSCSLATVSSRPKLCTLFFIMVCISKTVETGKKNYFHFFVALGVFHTFMT
jgi:hypothetical protein